MSTQDAYEEYYVPHNSKLPIFASFGIFLTLYGMGNMFNEMTAGDDSSFGAVDATTICKFKDKKKRSPLVGTYK